MKQREFVIYLEGDLEEAKAFEEVGGTAWIEAQDFHDAVERGLEIARREGRRLTDVSEIIELHPADNEEGRPRLG